MLILMSRLVGGFVRFLGLFNLFKGLKCGESFLLADLWVDHVRPEGMFSPAGVSFLFQGLSSLSRELRCGTSFLLYSLLVLFTWVLTILVSFVMLVVYWTVVVVLSLFELVNDGDLLLLIERMLHLRGLDTVRISKVKGHADDGMVQRGQVR